VRRGPKPCRGLTPGQQKVLAFVAEFIAQRRFPPTWREIATHLGATSTNAAHDHIKRLVDKGMVTKQPSLSRSLVLTDKGRDELAWIAAEAAERGQLG
jgi:repressor LexA